MEEVEQVEVQNWFEQQVKKAKKFQPLAALNQKLRGLEVFEPNSNITPPPTASLQSSSRQASPAPSQAPREVDPDDLITKTHWQRHTGVDACSDPACGKRLGTTNGNVNCRHCGKLFCDEHTLYQMKLSRSAQHEPQRGYWYRVCETCFKSRTGYNDHGLERSHTNAFLSARRKTVDKAYLEVSRLEKRLTRLTQLLANPPAPDEEQSTGSFLWSSIAGNRNHIRTLEQSIVIWEDDAKVLQCPFCQQPFSQYSFRRHHCRLCGRVVCGDINTACSTEVALNAAVSNKKSEKCGDEVAVDVRMCKDCQHTLFSKSDFAREMAVEPPDQRAYQNLVQFERGIRLLLPKFQRLLQALQDPDKPPSPTQLSDAQKVRKRLIDAFTQYDVAARRIRDLPTESATQARLQKTIHAQATSFLHLHMLPLKALPKLIKHATPSTSNGRPSAGPLAAIRNERSNSSASSSTATRDVTALETEEKELRERLIVLEEQKFMVQEMVNEAKKKRRFDEVSALGQNVDDLSREIDAIQSQIKGMDFEGAYVGDGDGTIG